MRFVNMGCGLAILQMFKFNFQIANFGYDRAWIMKIAFGILQHAVFFVLVVRQIRNVSFSTYVYS